MTDATIGPLGSGALGQVSRQVADIAVAEAWYGGTLGLGHLYTFGKLAFFDCDGVRLYLQEAPAPLPPQSVLYFAVPEIAAAVAALADRGVSFRQAPQLIHRHADGVEEWMAFFSDPDGNLLAVMERRAPG